MAWAARTRRIWGNMNDSSVIETYLSRLGIDPGAARIYLELSLLGHSSAAQLARKSGTSRTQTYRYLESLQSHGLVSAEKLSYGSLFRALPLTNTEATVSEREAETALLRNDLGAAVNALQHLTGNASPQAAVQHYYGEGGLKQVNWNITNAHNEFRFFTKAPLSLHLDAAFTRRCRRRLIDRRVRSYDLVNTAIIPHHILAPLDPKLSYYRHIAEDVLAINFEMCIYNDVVALFDYSSKQPHAMEIHNQILHDMMKQLFSLIWNMAAPVTITR